MKALLIVIIILVLAITAFLLYVYFIITDLGPQVKVVEVYSSNLEERIFIKKKNWGLLGNDQIIVISKSDDKSFEPDSTKEYIFKGLSPFFYNFKNDTLNLYIEKESNVPSELFFKIKINQILLSNLKLMELYSNYKEKGLKKL